MERWRTVWRNGFVPLFSAAGLAALRDALATDDPRLLQSATSSPPPLACVADFSCEAGCGVAFAGWKGNDLETVGEVEEFFARACYDADQRLGEPAACHYFISWFDDTPRDIMRRELLAEVDLAIAALENHAEDL